MAAGEHELVAVRMLGPPVVEPQAAELRPGQMRRDVVRRVRQRSAEVPGLRVVAQQHQRHAGHEADVFQALPVVGRVQPFERRNQGLCGSGQDSEPLKRSEREILSRSLWSLVSTESLVSGLWSLDR